MPEFAFNRPQESSALSDSRRLSGQHIQAPRGLPLPGTGGTNIPVHLNYTRGLASSLLHDPPTATSITNNISAANTTAGPRPPLTYEAQPRFVRPLPVTSTKAAEEWHKLEEDKARKAHEEAAAGNGKPVREVDSRTGSKAVPTEKATLRAKGGTIHGAAAINDTVTSVLPSLRGSLGSQHATASHSSRSPIPPPGSHCVVPPGGPCYVIRRVDPTLPLPQRPSGRPPVVVTGPAMFHAMHPKPLPAPGAPKPDTRAARASVTSLMGLQRIQGVGRGERYDDGGSEKEVSTGRPSLDGGASARVVAPDSFQRSGAVVRAICSSHVVGHDGGQAIARLDATASKTIEAKTQRKRHTRSSVETVLSVESTEFAAPSARPVSRSVGDRSALSGRQSMSHEETLAMLEGRGARIKEHNDEGAEVLPEMRKAVWSMFWDEEVEAEYYYNALTGEATWIKPADFDGRSDFYVTADIEVAVEAAAPK